MVRVMVRVCCHVRCHVRCRRIVRDQLYFSQKQLPRKMKSRLVITECAGYIFWQLFFAATIVVFGFLLKSTISCLSAPIKAL